MADETYFDAVCPQCRVSRYRSKGPFAPTTVAKPELFAPLGDSPPAEGYADGLRCYECDATLRFMPIAAEAVMPPADSDRAALRQEKAMARERASRMVEKSASRGPETPLPATNGAKELPEYQVTLFEAKPGEDVIAIDEVGAMTFLVKTTKRILIVDANQILEATDAR